jgi:hypothetical protein
MAAVEDEETQRKGLVGIVYNMGSASLEFDAGPVLRCAHLRNSLPARYSSVHYCYNNPRFADFVNYERCAFDRHTRARCRAHKGKFQGVVLGIQYYCSLEC